MCFSKTFGSGDKTYINTEEIKETQGSVEQEAYDKIEEALGTKVVRIIDKPINTKFLEMQLDQDLQEAVLYYLVGDNVLSYRIVTRYIESSIGMDIQDKLIQQYNLSLPETDVLISEYEIQKSGQLEYTAKFEYNNMKYFIQGIMNQDDFENIIKNLIFF